jgi:MFS family permease
MFNLKKTGMNKSDDRSGYLFSKGYSNYVFVLLFLLYMFDYIDRMVVTSMFTSIERDLGISHMKSGLLVSAVYWAIVLLTFPVSILVDRWSRSKTIGIMAIMWSLATALCALTGNFVQLFMARMLIGVGEAGYAPGGSAMISGLYPVDRRARMMGLWNASIPLGSAIGVMLGGVIAAKLGWKHAFGIVAIPGMIVAILFLFVKDYKTVDLSFFDKSRNKIKMERKDMVKEFVTKPSVIYTYFGMAAVVFVTTAMLTWLPRYFEEVRKIPQETAGKMASYVMLLALIGAPLGGFLTDKWRKTRENARLMYPAVSTLLSAIVLFIALFLLQGTKQYGFSMVLSSNAIIAFNVNQSTIQYIVLLIFGVLVLSFISGAAAVTQDVIHPGLRATSYAIAVVVQNLLGASMAPVVIGKLYDMSNNIQTAMSILPIILLTGAVLFWLGSRYYVKDLKKVPAIELEAA